MMEDYRDTPEAAEAAYLAAKGLSPDQIRDNLQPRYGSSQGYAQFKSDLLEASEYDEIHTDTGRPGAGIGLRTENEDERLDDITTEDVDISLDQVIIDAFMEKVLASLKEDVYDGLPALTDHTKVLALIASKGRHEGHWGDNPDDDTVWTIFSLLTGETLTDLGKQDLKEELIRRGIFYDKGGSILLTPVFVNLEDPYKRLPEIQLQFPSEE